MKPEQLHADGWAIGFDDRFPSTVRIQQAILFARWDRHENLYAHPLVRPIGIAIYYLLTL